MSSIPFAVTGICIRGNSLCNQSVLTNNGGHGYMKTHPNERHVRDARVLSIYEV